MLVATLKSPMLVSTFQVPSRLEDVAVAARVVLVAALFDPASAWRADSAAESMSTAGGAVSRNTKYQTPTPTAIERHEGTQPEPQAEATSGLGRSVDHERCLSSELDSVRNRPLRWIGGPGDRRPHGFMPDMTFPDGTVRPSTELCVRSWTCRFPSPSSISRRSVVEARPRKRSRTRPSWREWWSASAFSAIGWRNITTCPASPARHPRCCSRTSDRVTTTLRLGSGGLMLPNHAPLDGGRAVRHVGGAASRAHRPRHRSRARHRSGHRGSTAPWRAGKWARRLPRATGATLGVLRRVVPRRSSLRRYHCGSGAWIPARRLVVGFEHLQRAARPRRWACRSRSRTTLRRPRSWMRWRCTATASNHRPSSRRPT